LSPLGRIFVRTSEFGDFVHVSETLSSVQSAGVQQTQENVEKQAGLLGSKEQHSVNEEYLLNATQAPNVELVDVNPLLQDVIAQEQDAKQIAGMNVIDRCIRFSI
jgi:hypothetical protein